MSEESCEFCFNAESHHRECIYFPDWAGDKIASLERRLAAAELIIMKANLQQIDDVSMWFDELHKMIEAYDSLTNEGAGKERKP